MSGAPAVRIGLVSAPVEDGVSLARRLVEEGVAACVNLLPQVRSIYRWKGEIEETDETLLILKIAADDSSGVVERIAALHPYETPEVVLIDVAEGLPSYLEWVIESTRGGS
ncbi:MAG: divalent cation tolerance protein CutA [Longimicrobiales bacterium]|nr:divalent cation tolerance protein CutA [Longimicrobiales bacterium]